MLIAEEHKEGREAEATAFIVKEKLGRLEWQGNSAFESDTAAASFDKIVDELREKSLTTCEVCGKLAERRSTADGWFKTLCPEDAEKLGYE